LTELLSFTGSKRRGAGSDEEAQLVEKQHPLHVYPDDAQPLVYVSLPSSTMDFFTIHSVTAMARNW